MIPKSFKFPTLINKRIVKQKFSFSPSQANQCDILFPFSWSFSFRMHCLHYKDFFHSAFKSFHLVKQSLSPPRIVVWNWWDGNEFLQMTAKKFSVLFLVSSMQCRSSMSIFHSKWVLKQENFWEKWLWIDCMASGKWMRDMKLI